VAAHKNVLLKTELIMLIWIKYICNW